MNNAPVDPAEVPVFTGNLDVLETKIKAISSGGSKVETAGSDVHKSFGGLSAFYKAPEAEQLFGVTQPVADTAHDLSRDAHTIAGALGTYAREVRPLVKQLEQLKADAAAFRDKVDGDDKWREDGDLTDENLSRRNKIAEVWTAFQAAERDCHATIVALVGGKALTVNDGSNKQGMYGYDAEALKQSKSLPWGDAVEESVPWWQVWEHAYDFGKGVIVDGVWGTIKGLGTLIGVDGADAAGQAWKGLAQLATGVAITTLPLGLGAAFWAAPEDKLPSWLRESRTAMKETGKALVAWDQWGSNPSRAAGAVTFNVLTAIVTRGGGAAISGAGKAGTVAKVVSVAGKVGHAIDPMTYVFKGAGAGLSKIGDLVAHLKNTGHAEVPKISDGAYSPPEGSVELPDGTVQLPKDTPIPEGATRLPNGNVKLPDGTVTFPPNTLKDPFTGKYMHAGGDLYNKDGSLFQRAEDATKEKPAPPATGTDNPRIDTPAPQKQPALASVGGRGDDITRVGSDISDPVRTSDNAGRGGTGPGDNTPTGRVGDHSAPGGSAGSHMPTNNVDNRAGGPGRTGDHAPTTGGGHTETPSTGGGRDVSGGSTTDNAIPGGTTADNAIPGSGHPESPGAGGLDDLGDSADGAAHTGDGLETGAHNDAAGIVPDVDPSRYGRVPNEVAQTHTGPLRPEQEADLLAELSHAKLDQGDRALIVRSLSKDPYGAGVAELINRGHLRGVENYDGILKMCKKGPSRNDPLSSMVPAAYMALTHATELQSRGFTRLGFEFGDATTPWDLDVYTRNADGGIDYGYQLKNVSSAKKVLKNAESSANQLDYELMRQGVAILDVHHSISTLKPRVFGAMEELAEETGVTFLLRFDDGAIKIPADGSIYP
ncbi:hypothetical protein ACFY12_07615 [Streptomyces sp. NPDC001339]|uniref:hypothetical protein n=1 Tax=Streptomyces sp. NPDC001339 TaxID=3364563 RepID=UPI0036AF20E4